MDALQKKIDAFIDENPIACNREEVARHLTNTRFTPNYKNMMCVSKEVSVANPTRQRTTMTMYYKEPRYDTEHIMDKNPNEYFITQVNTIYKYEFPSVQPLPIYTQIFITNYGNIGIIYEAPYVGQPILGTILNKHHNMLTDGMIDAIRLIFMRTYVKYEIIEKFLDEIAPN